MGADRNLTYLVNVTAMSVSTGISGPVNLCRRLFCEAVPFALVQQTLESVINKDQERFNSKWNFPLINSNHGSGMRQPLSNQIFNVGNTHNMGENDTSKNDWQPMNKIPSFYTNTPRRLKAHRRLPVSVAQKTHMKMFKNMIRSPETTQSVVNTQLFENSPSEDSNQDQTLKCVVPSPVLLLSSTNNESDNHIQIPKSSSTPYKFNKPLPLIITPKSSDTNPKFSFHNKSNVDLCTEIPSSSNHPKKNCLTILRSNRYSEQVVKRKSGTKVTDYFTIKRPRQSLK